MRWVVYVVRIADIRNIYKMLLGKHEGKNIGVDGKMILKWILRKGCLKVRELYARGSG
jgi:hypothetical protein